jgi:hypothetical protein
MSPIPALLILGVSALAVYWIWGALTRSKETSREEELREMARGLFGDDDSTALDSLYVSRFRMALRQRELDENFEETLRDTILIFNLRNRALEEELERESEFSVKEGDEDESRQLD